MNKVYQNPAMPIETRVADLLARMSLEEKIAQMHAWWVVLAENGSITEREDVSDTFSHRQNSAAVEDKFKLGVGQITRPLGTQSIDPGAGILAINALQRRIISESRWGIPAMLHEECLAGLMCQGGTLFPAPINLAASWDEGLVKQVAKAIREEAMSIGCHQGLAPVLDVSRDVRWGRTEETFGEDPYLVGIMATRYVQGLQGDKRDFLATLKHFVAHSFSEGGRNHAPVHLGQRELNDIFLLPFEMAIKLANAGSVMPAYHDIDNQPCHNDGFLLTEVLRHRWGFDGLIVADYGGISLLHQHHGVTSDHAASAASAFNAGLDIELPKDDCARFLPEALARGLISLDKIDEIVSRILREKFRLGLFEQPFITDERPALQMPATRDLAKIAALKSITLLENRGLLPLDPSQPQTIAVIGPTADDPLALLSGYSFPVHLILSDVTSDTQQIVTPLAATRLAFGEQNVRYSQGCSILSQRSAGAPMFPGDVGKTLSVSSVSMDESAIMNAVHTAETCDVALCFVGDLAGLFQSGTVGEGSDTDTLRLPGVQQQLLERIVATGVPTIVVLTGGRPYHLEGLEDKLGGLVMAFEPGQEGGKAIVDILTGRYNPSAKLALSVPSTAGAMPYYYNHKMKSGGTPIAYHFPCRYPFGYGLSYTRFEYSHLSLESSSLPMDGVLNFSLMLTNVGQHAGDEVIQVYIRDKVASLVRPLQELKAFARVRLTPGQQARVGFAIPTDMLNFTDQDLRRRVEPGDFELQIGASSLDIRLRTVFCLTGQNRLLPEHWRMESHSSVTLVNNIPAE